MRIFIKSSIFLILIMLIPPPAFIDATPFIERIGQNTGGTREKRILQSEDGKDWFFKCSEYKPAKDGKPEKYYKYEFWSEVIASQLGKALKLNTLDYFPACHGKYIGCISPHMITNHGNKLTEVGRYMTRTHQNFLPDDTKSRKEYTFQLLEETINRFELKEFWPFFFETIIFDAIIGNTDRHQENWAFIENNADVKLKVLSPTGRKINFVMRNMRPNSMAPIYDSGSSLGRELIEERVNYLLDNEDKLHQYISKGKAEIHWNGIKITHFELIENLLNTSYIENIAQASKFLSYWDNEKIASLVKEIDTTLPIEWSKYKIPDSRKDLIIKMLTLRAQKVRAILNV